MNAPTLVTRTIDSITVEWLPLTGNSTGNSSIISYDLRWDSGSGQTIYQLSDSLVTNYTVTGLTGGINYTFMVRAMNIYGYGAYSSNVTIEASDVPQVMAILNTSIVSGTYIRVQWTAPFDSYDPITAYSIMFQKADGTFVHDATDCPGTNTSLLYCDIQMLSLITLTGLTQGSLIRVIGSA